VLPKLAVVYGDRPCRPQAASAAEVYMDSELLAVLLGALIGSMASLWGSVIVNRMQLRRTTRIRIYDELLPKLRRAYTGNPAEPLFGAYDFPYGPFPEWFIPTVRDVYRSSVVSGGKDRHMAERLQSVTLDRAEFYSLSLERTRQHARQAPGRDPQGQGDPGEFFEVERQVVLALDDYERHLEARLSGLRRLSWIWIRNLWWLGTNRWAKIRTHFSGEASKHANDQHHITE
jgi:hypothetical protein